MSKEEIQELGDEENIIQKYKKKALVFAELFAGKYKLQNRLNPDEETIFIRYFASYRVLTEERNGVILDLQSSFLNDLAKIIPGLGKDLELNDLEAESIRKASKILREDGDLWAEEYQQNLQKPPSLLLRAANMMSVHANEDDRKKRDELIRNYLDRELPIQTEG